MNDAKPKKVDESRKPTWQSSRTIGLVIIFLTYLLMLSALPEIWYLGIGALLNTAMFLFISIPMAETNLARYKDDYAVYHQQTRMLLPMPKK